MIIGLILYALASASGLILIKKSLSELPTLGLRQIAGVVFSGTFAIGFVLYLAAFLYWLYMLIHYELSKAFPIASGLMMLFTVVLAAFFLREKLSLINILGIVLMQISIVMINYGRAG